MTNTLKTISPDVAYKLCQDDVRTLLIDIRSSMEFLFVGHPVGAVHVPWIDEPDWVINKHFATDVRKLILGGASDNDSESGVHILLICRSGKRSKDAGNVLIEAGLSNVYNIEQGFEGELDSNHHRSTTDGWRFAGLPWEQC